MKQRKWWKPSSEQEEVYHAASRCQAASLSLTPRRLQLLTHRIAVPPGPVQ
ncbi:MAG: hypothetical protein ABI406_13170 [Ktedonobacteraceae bacterium]